MNELRLGDLFEQALQLSPDEREPWIEAIARESPTRAHSLRELLRWDAQTPPEETSLSIPDHFDGYRIIRSLGRGGMGEVYLAEREVGSEIQKVAIKFTFSRLDMREAAALARLDHPGIARLIDFGTAAGRGFLVMEYVDGEPLGSFLAKHPHTLYQRVGLLMRVAEAVSYAHRQLLIHRDLKFENVLVKADGTVKVIDFGLSRSLPARAGVVAQSSSPIFTLQGAAPEQISGQALGTGCDVFALGLMLYRLISGRHAFDRGGDLAELIDAILHSSPALPSRFVESSEKLPARQMRSLDAVCMKCLEKQPSRRYNAVDQLIDDLNATLLDSAISIRPGSVSEKALRFVARYRIGLAATSTLLFLFFAYLVQLSSLNQELKNQYGRAEQALVEARQIQEMLVNVFSAGDPYGNSQGVRSVAEVMSEAAEDIRRNAAIDGRAKARALDALAIAMHKQKRTAEADQTLKLARELLPDSQLEPSEIHRRQLLDLRIAGDLGDIERARVSYQRMTIEAKAQSSASELQSLTDAANAYGVALYSSGKQNEGRLVLETRLGILRHHPEVDQFELLRSLIFLMVRDGDWQQADALFPDLMKYANSTERKLRARSTELRIIRSKPETKHLATQLHREYLVQLRNHLGERHIDVALASLELGNTLVRSGKELAEAQQLFRESADIWQERGGVDTFSAVFSIRNLGVVSNIMGDYESAIPAWRQALRIWSNEREREVVDLFMIRLALARALADSGNQEEAEELLALADDIVADPTVEPEYLEGVPESLQLERLILASYNGNRLDETLVAPLIARVLETDTFWGTAERYCRLSRRNGLDALEAFCPAAEERKGSG